MSDFFDAGVWEQEWQSYGEAVAKRRAKAGIDMSTSFNNKAERFNQQSFDAEGRKRSARILDWLSVQGMKWEGASVLDVGAASGVFTVPMAERGAAVTAVESSGPLVTLLRNNTSHFPEGQVQIVSAPYEHLESHELGGEQAFDLVFVSMCPVVSDWGSVQRLLDRARQFCYISMPVSTMEHSLLQEIWPVLTDKPLPVRTLDMGYLLHLLYLKGYAYQSLVTREEKTQVFTLEEARSELETMLPGMLAAQGLALDEQRRQQMADYLHKTYPSGNVVTRQGGRYGKVLIRLQDQQMYG